MSDGEDTEITHAFAAVAAAYMAAFNAGDVDAAVDLYTADGVAVIDRGSCAAKADGSLERAFRRYFATSRPHLDFAFRHVYVAGDVALGVTDWVIESKDGDGRTTRTEGSATDVLRRDAGGTWRFAIDNRYGST
jgi:uncharacterized protein (TIGR02246 family)